MSITLAPTETLEIVLPGPVATNELHVSGAYSDQVSAGGNITAQTASVPITVRRTNGATVVTVVPAQGSDLPRIVTDLQIYNADSVKQTPKIQINAAGVRTVRKAEELAAGATLEMTPKSGWKISPAQSVAIVVPFFDETPTGTIDGSNAVFTLSQAPTFLILFKNGVKQRAGSSNDFTLAGATITFTAGAIPNGADTLNAVYFI